MEEITIRILFIEVNIYIIKAILKGGILSRKYKKVSTMSLESKHQGYKLINSGGAGQLAKQV